MLGTLFTLHAKTVSATKQNIQSYQIIRGSLISNAYEVKNNSMGLIEAINGKGAEDPGVGTRAHGGAS